MGQFGEILSELRQDRKMTQRELAEVLFVSVGTISNYEKGVHFPDIEKLVSLADFFHVSTDYLLGRCASPFSPDIFQRPMLDTKTIGEVVEDLMQMSSDRKNALSLIMNDMKLSMMIKKYNGKGEDNS